MHEYFGMETDSVESTTGMFFSMASERRDVFKLEEITLKGHSHRVHEGQDPLSRFVAV